MSRRILVVDDDEAVAVTFQEVLLQAGYDVTVATDGYDALEKAAAGSYDLITMDIRMPRLDGIMAAQQIMDMVRLRRMVKPVIVIISGYVNHYKDKLSQISVRHVISKPIGAEELCEIVKQAFEEHETDDL